MRLRHLCRFAFDSAPGVHAFSGWEPQGLPQDILQQAILDLEQYIEPPIRSQSTNSGFMDTR